MIGLFKTIISLILTLILVIILIFYIPLSFTINIIIKTLTKISPYVEIINNIYEVNYGKKTKI
jgi:uncharacterized BrkB/YihY/UPF0761 family membrane protein